MAQPPAKNGELKILSLVWFPVWPPRFGGQKAVALFEQHLAALAPLVCLCSKENQPAGALALRNELPAGKGQFLNPFVWRTIYRTAKNEGTTHLLLEFPYHGLAAVLCKRRLGVKLVVHEHNLEFLRFREQGRKAWRLLFLLEKWTLKNADAVFFKTDADLQAAKKHFRLSDQKWSVVPYGVDEKRVEKQSAEAALRQRHRIGNDEKILLFAGTLDYRPNAEAVVALHQKLIPLLNAEQLAYKIIVCGRNRFREFAYLNGLQNDRLIAAGDVENVDDYFAAADVFLNPVLTGGGVQTKTLEALSFHRNVVCFASKTAGINDADDKLFAVPDGDWAAFAKAVVQALSSNKPTPPAFFETHNWRTIAAAAYQKMADC